MTKVHEGTLEMRGNMSELDRTECLRLLAGQSFGRLAVSMGDGAPVIRPVNYIFDESSQSVAFRTDVGSKLMALARSAHAAFEIDDIDPETRSGWSVIIVGVAEEVTSPVEVRRLESLGLEQWRSADQWHWVRIRAWRVSGRRIGPDGETS
jgi:uncharacterized protein